MSDEMLVTHDTQTAIDIAVLKATQATHERRISAVEKMQTQTLITGLIAALSSIGTLIMFILTKVHFQ